MVRWELSDGREQMGPFDEDQVVRLIGSGLSDATLIRPEGDPVWKGLREHQGFARALEHRGARSSLASPPAPAPPRPAPAAPASSPALSGSALVVSCIIGALVILAVIVRSLGSEIGGGSVTAPPPKPVAADPPPVARNAPAQRANVNVADFLRWVAANRKAPQKIRGEEPKCETTGPTRGLCSVDFFPSDADITNNYTAKYFKGAPTAARFEAVLDADVSCSALGAALVRRWSERAGMFGAGGESCEFHDGPLKDLRVLIERNRDTGGKLNPSLHVYSADYLTRDADFAEAVSTDESR